MARASSRHWQSHVITYSQTIILLLLLFRCPPLSAVTITPRAWRRRRSHFRVSWQCHIKYITTILLRNIRQSQYRECFLFSFGRIATRHVIMIDVASGGGEESTCRWDMREHERTFNHTVANFFSPNVRFHRFETLHACYFFFFCYLLFSDCRFTHPWWSTHVYTVDQGCGGPIFSRKCNFKGIANWIWGVTAARGGDRRRQVRVKGVDKPFLRFDVIANINASRCREQNI